MIFSIDKDAFMFVLPLVLLLAAGIWFRSVAVICLAVLAVIFILFFFRDPPRSPLSGNGIIVSPAFGTVVEVLRLEQMKGFDGAVSKVSIFLSLFDVHINYAPVNGIIRSVEYVRGRFAHAGTEAASKENAANNIWIDCDNIPVFMRQIAGVVARRVVCRKKQGGTVTAGEKIGLMRFGSRMELFMPCDRVVIKVKKGDKVKGAQTVIGNFVQ